MGREHSRVLGHWEFLCPMSQGLPFGEQQPEEVVGTLLSSVLYPSPEEMR